MIIGIDYWQVLSHYPEYFCRLMVAHKSLGDGFVVISAVGQSREGSVQDAVNKILLQNGMSGWDLKVHEVVFDDPKQSPELKLAKCKELGVTVFFDDREDVCRLLNQNDILAMRVTRKDNSTYDLEAEQK